MLKPVLTISRQRIRWLQVINRPIMMSTRSLSFTCFCLCCFSQVATLTTAPPPSAIQKNYASDTAPLALIASPSTSSSQPLLFTSLNIAHLNYFNDSQVLDAGTLAYMTFPGLNFDPANSPINIGFKRNKLQAIDFSIREESIFVVELTSLSKSCLLRMTIGSPNVDTVIVGEGMITDIAVDWLSSNVYLADRPVDQHGYFIDGQPGSIKVTRADGQYSMTLPWGIAYPLGLSADSVGKRLFWTNYTLDMEQTAIGVINFDGTGLKVLWSTSDSHDPHQLAYNPADGRVYWTGDNKIRSIASDGGDLRVFITIDALDKTQHIAFYQSFALWTVEGTTSGSIGYAPIANASADVTMTFNKTTSNYTAPYAVIVYAADSQPSDTPPGPCTQNNGGCQQLCLPRQDNSAQCHCVDGNHDDCILTNVNTTATPPPTPSGLAPGGIAAIVVVLCIAIAAIVVIIVCIVKRSNRNTEKPVEQPSRHDSTYTVPENKTENPPHNYRTIGDAVPAEVQYETLPGDGRPQSILSGGQHVDLVEGGGASVTGNDRNSTRAESKFNSYLSLRTSHGPFSLFQDGVGVTTVRIETDGNHDNEGATQQHRTQSETTESPTTDYRDMMADQPTTSGPNDYQKLSKQPEQRSPYVSIPMSRDESRVE